MYTFGLSGCRVKPQRLQGPLVSHDNPRTPNVHISGSRISNTPTKIPREDPPERHKKSEMVAGEEKKSAKFWAPLPGLTLPGSMFLGLVAPHFGAPKSVRSSVIFSSCFSVFLR